METLKKNLFSMALVAAVALGIALSVVPEKSEANVIVDERIPCSSNAAVTTEFYYIPCDTCKRDFGLAENEAKCKS